MKRAPVLFVVLGAVCLPMCGSSQPAPSPAPTLEPVAETRFLMGSLADPNFKSVDRMLKAEPADADAWKLARGRRSS